MSEKTEEQLIRFKTSDHKPYRILIVDDNPVNVKVVDIRLKKLGAETVCLTESTMAIDTIKENEFDLILLDVIMPEVSGLDILKWIRERYSAMKLPVIMVTAKVENQDLVEALQIGANDFITKPIDFQIAWARIDTHVTIKRFNDEVEEKRKESLKSASMGTLIDMAGSVAHEINNPLTIAMGRAQILQMLAKKIEISDEEKKNKLINDLDTVYEAMVRAESVVSGLRAIARDERNSELQAFSLQDIIKLTFNVCRTTITAAGIKIKGDNDIEPALKVIGKQSMLIQIFYNLFKNSKEAIDEKQEDSFIEVKVRDNGEFIDILVIDSGEGIPSDIEDKIFDAFFTTKKAGTSGMGLTKSLETVESFGGTIKHDKSCPKTTFVVSLKKGE